MHKEKQCTKLLKIPNAWINPLLFQIFSPSLRALISEFSIWSPLDISFFPFQSHWRSTFQSHKSMQQLLTKRSEFCSCTRSTSRRSPERIRTLASGPQAPLKQLIWWNFSLEMLKSSKSEITLSASLSMKSFTSWGWGHSLSFIH